MTEDLDVFLADFGDTAEWLGIEAKVIVDAPGESDQVDMQMSVEYTVRFKSSDWPGLAYSESNGGLGAPPAGDGPVLWNDTRIRVITGRFGGSVFKIRAVRPIDDGAFTRAWLTRQ